MTKRAKIVVHQRVLARGLVLSTAVAGGLLASPARGQLTTWVGPALGSWGIPANWNNGVPNGAGAMAILDGGNVQNTTAVIDFTITLNSLTISAGDQASLTNNNTLNWSGTGTLCNAGTANLNANANNTVFSINGGTLNLVGSGVLNMNQTGAGGGALIQGGGTLVNSSTVAGMGALGNNNLSIINSGTIVANNGTQGLGIDPLNGANTLRNSGTLLANGGDIFLTGSAGGSADNTGGTISAAGTSSVRLVSGIAVTGGTFTTTAGAFIRVANASTAFLSGYANLGNFTVDNNSTAQNSGAIFNSGSVNLNAQANSASWTQTGVTLSGGGTFNFSESGAGGQAIFGSGGGTIANVDNTLRGRGQIGFNNAVIINQAAGNVIADVSGQTLNLDPANLGNAFVNQGTLRATNMGILQLTGFGGGAFDNTGGLVTADTASEARLVNSVTITGGTISTSGSGVVRVFGATTAFLNGPINLAANLFVDNNSQLQINTGAVNTGSISLNAAANSANLVLGGGTVSLSGGGTINLNQTGAGGTAFVTGSGTLVSDHTIQGRGNVGGNAIAVVNNGLITANNTNGGIGIDPANFGAAAFTNNGTITAAAAVVGLTGFGGGGFENTSGRIFAAGADVQLQSNVSVNGGTLGASAGSAFRVPAGQTASLSNVNFVGGNLFIENNATLNASGTLNNAGTITISAGANASQLSVSNLPLTGGGTIVLSRSGAGAAQLVGGGSFNNADHVIRGEGNLGGNALAITNQAAGLILADVPGGTLRVDPSNNGPQAFRNLGAMRAANGGILQLSGFGGGGFDNNGGSISADAGSTLQLQESVSVTGGAIGAVGMGSIVVPAGQTVFLSDLSLSGNVQLQNNSNTILSGTILNTGSINLNAGANVVQLTVNSTTLTGGGLIKLNQTVAGAPPRVFGSGSLITDHLIRGGGELGVNASSINNTGTVLADSGTFGLTIDPANLGAAAFTNNGTLVADGGVLTLTGFGGGGFTNNNRIVAATSDVQLVNSVSVSGGTLQSSGAGVFVVPAGQTVTVGNLTLAGQLRAASNATANVTGTVTNLGSISLEAAANPTNLSVGAATINGGGVISVGTTGAAEAVIAGSGTFTTDNTIQGRGNFGANGLTIVSSGLIHANLAAGPLTIDPANVGPTAYSGSGTLMASNGAGITLTGFGGGGFVQSGPTRILTGSTFNVVSSALVSADTVENNGAINLNTSADTTATHVRGDGTVTISNSARLAIRAGEGTLGTSRVVALNILTSGRLDLADHDLAIDYTGSSPIASIRPLLAAGYNNGPWNGNATMITTSAGAAASSTGNRTGIGYAEATQVLGPTPTSFRGVAVDANSVVLRYTLLGDADLTGTVDIDDFGRLASNFNTPSPWFNGDFNYSGTTDIDDFGLLAANFNKSLPGQALGRGTAVPEPSMMGVLAVLLTGSMTRLRRRVRRATKASALRP